MHDVKELLAGDLEGARQRSLDLLAPLSDADQVTQHSPLMSPLVWDLAHVGHYEELWLLRAVARTQPLNPLHDDIYDAFRHPRKDRSRLALLGPAEARSHIAVVRGQVLDVLERVEFDPATPLLAEGFVYRMVAQHEHQHDETMLATLQLMGRPYPNAGVPAPPGRPMERTEVLVPGGSFVMGTDTDPWAYDNERPAHAVEVDPFWIDTSPVTNCAYADFIAAGGYREARWWSEAGWKWRMEAGLTAPEFWRPEGDGSYSLLRYGVRIPLPGAEPVQHVCFYEAEAYAAWAGKRLPTEEEWEKAASWAPDGHKRRLPWGDGDVLSLSGDTPVPPGSRANLGQRHFGPAPVGAYPAGASAWGVEHMLGDVWEWTASDFRPYTGFASFPYKEYSEVFYGSDHKVLRGGSWATHPLAVRTTFRNWDYPIRRQIFAGFRCARDA
ncbi:MAG: ergothioneine biosynthesis protein EgtB [Actinomycetota bacterium]|nr:ergothioneine biosynthesis protein EgtB [Actinomycetota bacterium]